MAAAMEMFLTWDAEEAAVHVSSASPPPRPTAQYGSRALGLEEKLDVFSSNVEGAWTVAGHALAGGRPVSKSTHA